MKTKKPETGHLTSVHDCGGQTKSIGRNWPNNVLLRKDINNTSL